MESLKVGDKVRVKSREWYEANKNKSGVVFTSVIGFTSSMAQFCGRESEIVDIHPIWESWIYSLKDFPGVYFSQDMFEEPPKSDLYGILTHQRHELNLLLKNSNSGGKPQVCVDLINPKNLLTDIKLILL